MGQLFDELKRRKVFSVAGVYAIVAWLSIQVIDILLPTFGAPEWVNQSIIILFIIGFPVALIFAWAYEITPEGVKTDSEAGVPRPVQHTGDRKLMYATFVLVVLVAVFQIVDRFVLPSSQTEIAPVSTTASRTALTTSVLRSSIILQEPLIPAPTFYYRTSLELTQDGSRLFYTQVQPPPARIMTRLLSETESQLIYQGDSTTLVAAIALSPDNQKYLIRGGSSLLSLGQLNSPLITLISRETAGRGIDWLSNNEIVHTVIDQSIQRLNLIDESKQSVTGHLLQDYELHYGPQVLPGGQAMLFGIKSAAMTGGNHGRIAVVNLENGESHTLVTGGYAVRYAMSGHVIFVRSGSLWAVPFDLDSLQVIGEEVEVISDVYSAPDSLMGNYAISDNGRLVYLPGPDVSGTDISLVWMDRNGQELEVLDLPVSNITDPRLSPNGDLLSLTVRDGNGQSDIWIYNLQQNTFNRRTFSGDSRNGMWTPDGLGLIYAVENDSSIWRINANGIGQAELLRRETIPGLTQAPESFNQDTMEFVHAQGPLGVGNLHVMKFSDAQWSSRPLVEGPLNYWGSSISPDGRWIAFTNNESGYSEIYISPYPNFADGRWQISTGGGREAQWSQDGRELYYLRPVDQSFMAVSIEAGDGIEAGTPQVLFSGISISTFDSPSYDVHADSEKFLIMRRHGDAERNRPYGPATLTVVENWFEELKRLAPADPSWRTRQ